MTHSTQQTIFLFEKIGSINFGSCCHRHAIVVKTVKAPGCIAIDHLFGNRTPLFVYFLEIPTLLIVDRRVDIDILQQVERGLDRNLVVDTRAHPFEHFVRKEILLFGIYGVTKRTGVLQRDLLIPTLFANRIFTLEGVDTRHIQHNVRERKLYRGIP